MRKWLAHTFKIREKEREEKMEQGSNGERQARREGGKKINNLTFEGKRKKTHMLFLVRYISNEKCEYKQRRKNIQLKS